MWGQRQDYFGRDPLGLERADEIADEGEITYPWNRDARTAVFLLEQSAEHDGFTVFHVQHRLSRAIAELELGDWRIGLQRHLLAETNDLNFHLERQFISQVDSRLHRQLDAGVPEFDGCDSGCRRYRSGGSLARKHIGSRQENWLLVADVDFGLLIIDHANFWSRQRFRIRDLLEEVQLDIGWQLEEIIPFSEVRELLERKLVSDIAGNRSSEAWGHHRRCDLFGIGQPVGLVYGPVDFQDFDVEQHFGIKTVIR